jgi:hypothetical protein
VAKWVRSLLDADMEPTIALLEEVQDWANAERYCVRQMRAFGCRLANLSEGGEGGSAGWVASAETRERMSVAAKERCADSVERVRLASIGNRKPPVGRGEKNGFARFTEAQVIEMRERRAAGEPLSQIATVFGTAKGAVQDIVTGKTWAHVGGSTASTSRRNRLSETQVDEVKYLVKVGTPQNIVAGQYGVSPSYISQLVNGKRRINLL